MDCGSVNGGTYQAGCNAGEDGDMGCGDGGED